MDDYVIGYTSTGKAFYFDKEHYERVSEHYWICKSGKNIVTKIDDKQIVLASFIFGEICTYKNKDRRDCRSSNVSTFTSKRGKKKIKINGYIELYMPEHHRSSKTSGCVYEHIIIAEKMLGRELLPDEEVHNKDKNRSNNDEENLMVFATKNDHIAYHAGAEAVLQENGSYKCQIAKIVYRYNNILSTENPNQESVKIIEIKDKDICPYCEKRLKSKTAKRCRECDKEYRRRNFPPKEELEKYIYKLSYVKIGEMYGMTDGAVRKWCKAYNIHKNINT